MRHGVENECFTVLNVACNVICVDLCFGIELLGAEFFISSAIVG